MTGKEARILTNKVLEKSKVESDLAEIFELIKSEASDGGNMIVIGNKINSKEDRVSADALIHSLRKNGFMCEKGKGYYWYVSW